MTKEFDERNMAKSRRVCEAMAKAASTGKRVLTGRERQILDMWPRFEDGEPVIPGDQAMDGYGSERTINYITVTGNGNHIAEDMLLDMVCRFDERVKRPVQTVLDADGVEIKVGDTVWYRSLCTMGSTRKATVAGFDEHSLYGLLVTLKDEAGKTWYIHPKKITHTPPDSWGRLEEDAQKNACDYFGVDCDSEAKCRMCPHFQDDRDCSLDMNADLIRRAKKLAGVSE